MKDLKKAIDAKRAEAQTNLQAFNDKKAELANNPNIDVTDPQDPGVLAAEEAMKPYSKSAEELKDLEAAFERLALMEAAGGGSSVTSRGIRQVSDLDRDYADARRELGRVAAQSDSYRELREAGHFNDGTTAPMPTTELTAPMDRDRYASLLTGGTGSAGGVLNVPERFPGVVDLPQLPINVMQLFTVGNTDSNAVEFVRILARTINAAAVAEATKSGDIDGSTVTAAEGGQKPESGITFQEVTESVRTFAHWMPATRNMLADAAFLETLVRTELINGVNREEEDQTLNGTGTAPEIRGILNTSGRAAYTQGDDASGEPSADAVHRILTMIALAGFNATAVAFNALDWQEIRLTKDNAGNYIWGPPSMAGGNQIWGRTAITSAGLAQGTAVAGEWARALFLIREGVKVLVSDSHKDWFTRNLIALLGESRGVLVVPRPQAFGEVTFA